MLAALLALLAVLCAGVAPEGYMPGRTAGGGWGLVLCPDGGPAPVQAPLARGHSIHIEEAHAAHHSAAAPTALSSASDHAGHAAPEPPVYDDGSRCAWATASGETGRVDNAALLFGEPVGRPRPAAEPPARASGRRGLAAPPPPSHAPPLKV